MLPLTLAEKVIRKLLGSLWKLGQVTARLVIWIGTHDGRPNLKQIPAADADRGAEVAGDMDAVGVNPDRVGGASGRTVECQAAHADGRAEDLEADDRRVVDRVIGAAHGPGGWRG